jgi:chorismate dehydratase
VQLASPPALGSHPSAVTPRIGGVPYGVGAPLVAGLAGRSDVDLVKAPPTQLIERLRRGDLDTALVSSVEAIRAPGYTVFAPYGIACKREIRSVRAFARRDRPVRRVALDDSSATSVALLRLLLAGPRAARTAPPLEFTTVGPTIAPSALPHDLVLMIGDHGLAADPGELEAWDLGAEWVRWTGLPFVFAVWLVRPGFDATEVAPALRAAREHGRHLGPVDGTHGAAHYDLDAGDQAGLRQFWAACRAAGMATEGDPQLLDC